MHKYYSSRIPITLLSSSMLFNLANSQEESSYNAAATANVEGEGSEDDGLGMAEIIAIIICGLIICAFLLACCVMVRNA